MLPSAVMAFLPTPRASDTGTPGRRASEGFRPPLSQVILRPASTGDSTDQLSDAGSRSLDAQRLGQLTLDELATG
jgi:hypothetical protein